MQQPTLEPLSDLSDKLQNYALAEWNLIRTEAQLEWEARARQLRLSRNFLSIAMVLGVVAIHQILQLIEFWFLRWRGEVFAQWFAFFIAVFLVGIAGVFYHEALRRMRRAFSLPERRGT